MLSTSGTLFIRILGSRFSIREAISPDSILLSFFCIVSTSSITGLRIWIWVLGDALKLRKFVKIFTNVLSAIVFTNKFLVIFGMVVFDNDDDMLSNLTSFELSTNPQKDVGGPVE